jgi:hypothetical protein
MLGQGRSYVERRNSSNHCRRVFARHGGEGRPNIPSAHLQER